MRITSIPQLREQIDSALQELEQYRMNAPVDQQELIRLRDRVKDLQNALNMQNKEIMRLRVVEEAFDIACMRLVNLYKTKTDEDIKKWLIEDAEERLELEDMG